jgi:outer membrane protein assembly factor BamB
MRTSGRFSADGNVIFGVNFRDVAAYQAHDGRPIWTFPTRLDPLGTPRVDESVGVAVIVDDAYVARGLDAGTGKELWALPTRVENPRVTMASGLVLLDQPDAGYQVLLDSRTGVRLPEPPTRIIDLKPAGALVIQDGVPGVISPHDLRTPPPTADGTTVPG